MQFFIKIVTASYTASYYRKGFELLKTLLWKEAYPAFTV